MSEFMLCLNLFWTFFKIGLFTIGGGQAMIPLILELSANGAPWPSESQLTDMIGIAESTPGPIAINVATYTGMEVAGVGGAIMATLGVVLPSVIIILLVATFFSSFLKKRSVQGVLVGVRSVVTGLLLAVLLAFILEYIFSIDNWQDTSTFDVDYIGLVMFLVLLPLSFVKIKGKKIKPIFVILTCAIVGMLCYGFIPVY